MAEDIIHILQQDQCGIFGLFIIPIFLACQGIMEPSITATLNKNTAEVATRVPV